MAMPFWAGFLFTLAFMMLFGIILQVVVLRPLIGEPVIQRHHGRRSASSIFFQALMKWMFGVFAKPFPPIFTTERINVLGLQVQTVYLLSLGISLLIMAGFAWFFKFSQAWAGDAGDGLRPAGGAVAGRLGAARSSPCPGRSRRWCRRSRAWWSAW